MQLKHKLPTFPADKFLISFLITVPIVKLIVASVVQILYFLLTYLEIVSLMC
jgi:hypothetical protein